MTQLRQLSSSPHDPEYPRAHPVVTLAAKLANRRGSSSLQTPHLCHGADLEKTQYEYDLGPFLRDTLGPWMDLGAIAGRRVLDVGCGWGGKAVWCAEHLRPARVEGFDLPGVFRPEVPLEFAKKRGVGQCGFRTGYAEAIPHGDGEFDFVMCEDVLEHVEDPQSTLKECGRVLRSHGVLVALFPSFRMLDAHHLDRALMWPGLHYVLSLKTWAAGLNHFLLKHQSGVAFEPFSEAVVTRFNRCVTRDLNGMDYRQFGELLAGSRLVTETLRLLPRPTPDNGRSVLLKRLYRLLCRVPALEEILCERVLYIARKP
jgi:ubiquinone/menaquinone biosynthesis C-methylase UbiE